MKKILIVEDDTIIAETVELFLRNEGYKTERAANGRLGLELWRAFAPDLIILDIGLPELDGLEVLQVVRTESDIPVVMLTARAEEIDELLALGMGADDYITKPFSPKILIAHIKAVLKRDVVKSETTKREAPLRIGEIEIDSYQMLAKVGEHNLNLTPTEYKLLYHLAKTPGRAISRWELLEASMPESDALERAVDTHMKNLRQKLEDAGAIDIISTVWGVGYRFNSNVEKQNTQVKQA